MQDARTVLDDLLKQLDVADGYAAQQNPDTVPSLWQIQNGLIREKAREALSSVTSQAP